MKIQREKLAQAGLPEEQIKELLDVVESYPTVFNGDLTLGSGLRSYQVHLKPDAGRPPQAKSRPLNAERLEWLRGALKKLSSTNVITQITGSEPVSSLPMHI